MPLQPLSFSKDAAACNDTVESLLLFALEFEHTLLFLVNDRRVEWTCGFSKLILGSEREEGKQWRLTGDTLIEPVIWSGPFVWSHLGLSVFPLDQLPGWFCQTFRSFHPPPPSVCDCITEKAAIHRIKFLLLFLSTKGIWFSGMICTSYHLVGKTQLDAQQISIPLPSL